MQKIDILVCCSGVPGDSLNASGGDVTRIENLSEDDWDSTIDTNLKGVFSSNRAVIPYFKGKRKGKITNISSIAGRSGSDWIPHYSDSKAGVIVLSQTIAAQVAPLNMNCPSFIWTLMSLVAGKIMANTCPQFSNISP